MPNEDEYVLALNSEVEVECVLDAVNGLVMVQLKQLPYHHLFPLLTPLLTPNGIGLKFFFTFQSEESTAAFHIVFCLKLIVCVRLCHRCNFSGLVWWGLSILKTNTNGWENQLVFHLTISKERTSILDLSISTNVHTLSKVLAWLSICSLRSSWIWNLWCGVWV